MKHLIILCYIILTCNACINENKGKVFIGMNPVIYDHQLTNSVYTDMLPPPTFEGEIGTFNICIDTLNNFYYYTFKPKHFCGYMLQNTEHFEPYQNEMKALVKDSFYKADVKILKALIANQDRNENFIAIGLPKDTIINAELNELLNEIHSIKRIGWKTRRLNEYEEKLIKQTYP